MGERSEKEGDEGENSRRGEGECFSFSHSSILHIPPFPHLSTSPLPLLPYSVSPFPFSRPSVLPLYPSSHTTLGQRWSQGTGKTKYFRRHRVDDREVHMCELTPCCFCLFVGSSVFPISLSLSLSHTHTHTHMHGQERSPSSDTEVPMRFSVSDCPRSDPPPPLVYPRSDTLPCLCRVRSHRRAPGGRRRILAGQGGATERYTSPGDCG
jgi:hypothetical protein